MLWLSEKNSLRINRDAHMSAIYRQSPNKLTKPVSGDVSFMRLFAGTGVPEEEASNRRNLLHSQS